MASKDKDSRTAETSNQTIYSPSSSETNIVKTQTPSKNAAKSDTYSVLSVQTVIIHERFDKKTDTGHITDDVKTKTDDVSVCGMLFSWRFLVVTLLHVSLSMSNLPRTALPMAVICMTGTTSQDVTSQGTTSQDVTSQGMTSQGLTSANMSSRQAETGASFVTDTNVNSTETSYEFTWSPHIVTLLLSAPVFAQVFGPFLLNTGIHVIGSKRMMVVFIGTSAVLHILSPASARLSPYLLMVCIVIIGMSRFTGQVIMGDILAWWCPAKEKVLFGYFIAAGLDASGIFSNVISGFICSVPFDNGWPLIFYLVGLMMFLFIALWCLFIARTPDDHPYISKREKHYIINNRSGMKNLDTKQTARPPYKMMLRSRSVYGYLIISASVTWVTTSMMAKTPKFLNKTLHLSPIETGVLMSLVYTVRVLCGFLWATTTKLLTSLNLFSTNHVRKITLTLGLGGASVCHLMTAWVVTNSPNWWIYSLLLAVNALDCVGRGVFTLLSLDMAPRYASALHSLQLTVSTLVGVTGPLTVGFLTPDDSRQQWQMVLLLYSAVTLAGTMLFCVLGEASLQPWATGLDGDVDVECEGKVNDEISCSIKPPCGIKCRDVV